MVLGTPGSGKTVLGLHFLAAGARKGERGLYFGFDEPAELLIEKADKIGLGFSDHIASGLIDIVWQPPLDNILDALAERLLTLVRAHRVSRLFIDGLSGLERAVGYPERMFAFFAALMIQLRSLGVTTVFSTEMAQLFGPEVELPAAYASGTTDNILFLRYVELRSHLYRLISIMKMRDSAYEAAIREFIITEHGIEVAATFESAEAILTGLGRPIASGERPTPSTPVMPANPTSPSTPPATGVGSSLTTPESAPSAALDLQPSSPRSQTANAGPEVQTRDHLHRQPGQPGQLGQPGTDEEERGTDEGDQEGGGAEEIGG
jgi:circadian clock protein KaiC